MKRAKEKSWFQQRLPKDRQQKGCTYKSIASTEILPIGWRILSFPIHPNNNWSQRESNVSMRSTRDNKNNQVAKGNTSTGDNFFNCIDINMTSYILVLSKNILNRLE
jgi:hypothetical protein